MDEDLYGFSLPYQGQLRLFRANPNKLRELKKLLDAKILYSEMNQFYIPRQQIGSGAFSQVQMVENIQTRQQVAAKFLNKQREGKSNSERMNDIINEIQILYRLNHPNIVKIKEIYDRGTQIVIIHEYVDGSTLEKYIADRGINLPHFEVQSIMRQILLAVVYIHEQGLLHRDIKPENIMIDKSLNIKLIDFGLATKQGSPLCIQRCGTPGYIAPEILASKKPHFNNKSDIFSIGAVFYKLITRQELFQQQMQQFEPLDPHLMMEYSVSDTCFDLMSKMLSFDNDTRINAKEALLHPYFKESQRPSAKKPFNILQQQSTMLQSQLSEGSRKISEKSNSVNQQSPFLMPKKGDKLKPGYSL